MQAYFSKADLMLLRRRDSGGKTRPADRHCLYRARAVGDFPSAGGTFTGRRDGRQLAARADGSFRASVNGTHADTMVP